MIRFLLAILLLAVQACHWIFPHDPGAGSVDIRAERSATPPRELGSADLPRDQSAPPDLRRDQSAPPDQRPDARVFSSVKRVAGSGATGHMDGPVLTAGFDHPHGVTVDAAGTIYVADYGSHTIRAIAGGFVQTFAGQANAFGNQDGASPRFNTPAAVRFGSGGELYVADFGNGAIRVIQAGAAATVKTGFQMPDDVVVDSKGILFLAEWDGKRVKSIANGNTTIVAGTGAYGFVDGLAAKAQFMKPHMLALDDLVRKLFVTDWDAGRVRVIDLQQGVVSSLTDKAGAPILLTSPAGIALDVARQRLYVSEATLHRIRVIDLAGGTSSVLAGSGVKGGSDGGLKDAQFDFPEGLALDAQGRLYVAEFYGQRVRVIE